MVSIRNIVAGVAAVAVALGCGGCSEGENENLTVGSILYDVAELAENDADGTVFKVYRPAGDECALLRAPGGSLGSDPELEAGDCVFLAYEADNGEAYRSGDIRVLNWGPVLNSALLKGTPESLDGWDKDAVWLQSLWRAGNKVIIRAMLSYDQEPRVFALVADETTLGDEYPEAYLVHMRRTEQPNFKRQFYAAFDVGALWSYESCRGLRIHVRNSNVPEAGVFVVEKYPGR